MDYIKIGTKVIYRPAWATKAPKIAKITCIEKCKREGDKYGKNVEEIAWISKNYGVYNLDDGHWCYGYQIDSIDKRHKVVLTHTTSRESLEVFLNSMELNYLEECMNKNSSMTLALYDFTHSPYCTKHHRYKIWNTFNEGEIIINIIN